MNPVSSAFFLSAALFATSACSSNTTSQTPASDGGADDGSTTQGDDAGAVEGTVHKVDTTNFAYAPAKLTIKVGDTVEWVFSDGTHTVTSGKDCTSDGVFDSKVLTSPNTYRRTFDTAGKFDYFCDYRQHCSMGQVGIVDVKP